jgi:hypothetical protein
VLQPLSFELIAPTEPFGDGAVLPGRYLTSGEKSSRKFGSISYAARTLLSAAADNLIWQISVKLYGS